MICFKLKRRGYSLPRMKHYWLFALAFIGLVVSTQAQPASTPPAVPNIKIMMISGGWAHDYQTWYHNVDTATLNKAGYTNIEYTEDSDFTAKNLSNADLMIMSANKGDIDTPAFRNSISNYIDAGKGAVLLHATLWYNWVWNKHLDEFNSELVGGGARDHDGEAPFTEVIVKDHPVTEGLPKSFPVTDELYHTQPMAGAAPMEVLAMATRGDEKYPSVWITHYGKSRIVCIALGHDGESHNSPYYQKLLLNAVKWASGKD